MDTEALTSMTGRPGSERGGLPAVAQGDSGARLRRLSAALAMAEERERRQLAEDLHDDLGQILAVARLKLAAAERVELPAEARRAIDECAAAVDLANRKLRSMAFQLSPPLLRERGLLPALEWLADEMRHAYGLDVEVADDGRPKPLDPAVAAAVYRAARELLINVARHARVESASVRLEVDGRGRLALSVGDAGIGFDPPAIPRAGTNGGFGLPSLRERIAGLGGDVAIHSRPGEGTSVRVRVPLSVAPRRGRRGDSGRGR